ncbi:hypothetical protein KIN20_016205 [Parelaphostrongylus tenuis]|uniref:Uncharacterized protein n=1 Tax=Parelaphostrongylus tenuis TaxID=148309 RepID=A0AAD5MG39_PARTN|nr:hypothetical protein KIN20_016205 [Parelaphostrongylus tenuis]
MEKLSINPFMLSLLELFSTVMGCGVLPAGQARTRSLTVTGLTTLPVAMVYAGKPEISTQVPGIAPHKAEAEAFVSHLVTQMVFDALESQVRSSFLPDAVISSILNQLTIKVNYEPMKCQTVLSGPTDANTNPDDIPQNCIIVGTTVTAICPKVDDTDMEKCSMKKNVPAAIPANHTSISGSLTTTNIIMANWSKTMWQNVVSKAFRILGSGPFGSHFFAAVVTIGEN